MYYCKGARAFSSENKHPHITLAVVSACVSQVEEQVDLKELDDDDDDDSIIDTGDSTFTVSWIK